MHGFDNVNVGDRDAVQYGLFEGALSGSGHQVSSFARRSGGRSLYCDNGNQHQYKFLPEQNNNTIYYGFGMYVNGSTYSATGKFLLSLMYGTSYKTAMGCVGTGIQGKFKLTILNGSLTTLLTSNYVFSPYTWYWVEAKIKLGVSTNDGIVELRVNGVVDQTVTSVNTNTDSSGKVDRLSFYIQGPSATYMDDFYILNDSGTYNNIYLGDVAIEALTPNGEGTYTQWTPSTGTTHYTMVDDPIYTNSSNAADYVSSDVLNNRDSFQLTDLSANTNVKGIMLEAMAWKSDSASRAILPFFVIDTVDYDIGTDISLNEATKRFFWIVEKNPNGNTEWTKTVLDSMQVGFKVTV